MLALLAANTMNCSCSCLGSGCVVWPFKQGQGCVRSFFLDKWFNGVVLLILLFKKIKQLMARIEASKIAFAYALSFLLRKLRSWDTQFFARSVNDKLFFILRRAA